MGKMGFIREVTIPSFLVWAIAWGIFLGIGILFLPSELVSAIIGGATGTLVIITIMTIIGLYND